MASTDWIEIYESYSDEKLAAEIARLQQASEDGENFTAQSVGGKSYQADPQLLASKLAAAIRVQTNSGSRARARTGVANFGNLGSLS